MPQPLEKSSELIARINAMIWSALDEAEIADLEREIALIERAGFYSQAKQLEGMLAGLHGDSEEVHRKFNAALLSSGYDKVVRTNYAQALANLHHLREAVEQLILAVEQAPDDINLLWLARKIYEDAYYVDGAERLTEQLCLLGQENRISVDMTNKLVRMRELLDEAGANWQDVSERIEQASSALLPLGLRVASISESFSECTALLEFNIKGDIDVVLQAEEAIHQTIAKQPYSPADKMMAFACFPV